MKTPVLPIMLTFAAACGTPDRPENLTPPPDKVDFVPDPADPGKMPAGQVPDVSSFAATAIAQGALSPVAAIAADGTRQLAVVRNNAGWPSMLEDSGDLSQFPGDPGVAATGVSMVASRDGFLHAVWASNNGVFYGRLDADGHAGDVQRLDESGRDATVAISETGLIVVAYTATNTEGYDQQINVVRGLILEGVVAFGQRERVTNNSACCIADGEEHYNTVSGPSLAIDANEQIHVVYEWTNGFQTTIEYTTTIEIKGDEAWQAPVVISEAAFSPCPALAVDEDGAHITFLQEYSNEVWYSNVRGRNVSQPVSLYALENGSLELALMHRDGNGAMHIVIQAQILGEARASTSELIYVRSRDREAGAPVTIASADENARLMLTPRAGGLLVDPTGRMHIPYTQQVYEGRETLYDVGVAVSE